MNDIKTERHAGLHLAYVGAIALGSFLLFLVQPMIARMALPRLGGSPAVWNSAMLVYQTLLLGGYAYAHAVGRLPARTQAIVHACLFVAAALWLPIGLSDRAPPANADPVLWAPFFIATSIGPLFLVVASQAPLLQRWYSLSGGRDPYPLYAASNLGSLAGLLCYPLILEPFAAIDGQRAVWSIGYGLLALGTVAAASRMKRGGTVERTGRTAKPRIATYLRWVALAAIPSGLMLSTTTYITTDIAATPMLWVLPLGAYLLSFVAAFSGRDAVIASALRVSPFLILVSGGLAFATQGRTPILSIPLGLGTLYFVGVALHGTMNRERPGADHLTGFYLAMSVGGALGGVFCALVAPALFDWVWEHPILLIASMLMIAHRPLVLEPWSKDRVAVGLMVASLLIVVLAVTGGAHPALVATAGTLAAVVVGLASTVFVGSARSSVAGLIALMVCGATTGMLSSQGVEKRFRSYFGTYRIVQAGKARAIMSGTTLHGVQIVRPTFSDEPLTYYGRTSGVAHGLATARRIKGGRLRVGVVGLGAGTLACYAQPGDAWRFYEIDPDVIKVAKDRHLFSYLSDCTPDAPVVEGDARISIAGEPDDSFDVLVLDAFSSDAIPAHIVTRQAFETYARKLAPGGMVLAHISNRHLNLEPVLAAERNWNPMVMLDVEGARKGGFQMESIWVGMSRDRAVMAALRKNDRRWRPAHVRPGYAGWTDQRSSIMPILIF